MLQHVLVVWFYKNTVILSVSEESPGMKRQRRSSDINPFRICDIHSCVRYKAAPCDMPAGVGGFISYRNRAKRGYIAWCYNIYRHKAKLGALAGGSVTRPYESILRYENPERIEPFRMFYLSRYWAFRRSWACGGNDGDGGASLQPHRLLHWAGDFPA